MRTLLVGLFFAFSAAGFAQQPGSFIIGVKGDTLNHVDAKGRKLGKWVIRLDEVRGEPGFEEEGEYKDGRREGPWRRYSLQGDLTGVEYYRWGNKDGVCQYFNPSGSLIREESWRAMNPDKPYDTLVVEDVDKLNEYKTVIVKNDGVAIRHGEWKYYDPTTGMIDHTEIYTMGKLENPRSASAPLSDSALAARKLVKPKEVQDFEKKNAGKKKVRVRSGETN